MDRRIILTDEARMWLHDLRRTDRETLVLITGALKALRATGPALGRPLVDTISDSALKNLKELRPGSSGSSEIRMLFVFDPQRNAVVLVAGGKARRWKSWYAEAIPLAEERYAGYLRSLKENS